MTREHKACCISRGSMIHLGSSGDLTSKDQKFHSEPQQPTQDPVRVIILT